MPLNPDLVQKCHEKLLELARNGERITYGDLAEHIGVAKQAIGKYLNEIYVRETIEAGKPDITVIPHYANSDFGKFNSRGRAPQTIEVDPENPAHVRAYKDELREVYKHWGGQPKGSVKRFLEGP